MFKRFFFAAVIFSLFAFTLIAQSDDSKKEPEVTVITINNARQSAYKKVRKLETTVLYSKVQFLFLYKKGTQPTILMQIKLFMTAKPKCFMQKVM